MADDVWVVIPTADPVKASRVDGAWARLGYRRLFLVPNVPAFAGFRPRPGGMMIVEQEPWRGYPTEVNALLWQTQGPVAVAAADDLFPDPLRSAKGIAAEYVRRFPDLDGILQPTGDPWEDSQGRVADRICGSPWIGRQWIQCANQAGAFWPEYHHFFADEEMLEVARAQGRLWQEPFLTHRHEHWHRLRQPRPAYMDAKQGRWDADAHLFAARKWDGFPDGGMA